MNLPKQELLVRIQTLIAWVYVLESCNRNGARMHAHVSVRRQMLLLLLLLLLLPPPSSPPRLLLLLLLLLLITSFRCARVRWLLSVAGKRCSYRSATRSSYPLRAPSKGQRACSVEPSSSFSAAQQALAESPAACPRYTRIH